MNEEFWFDLADVIEIDEDYDDTITRDDLLSVGINPSEYIKDGDSEIKISEIISAAKEDVKYDKVMLNTVEILNAYNSKNNKVKTLEKKFNIR